MKTFSEELKEARMARGLTLEELAASTKISLKILKALETGNFDVLPQTYIKGFLRTYAQQVGLDAVSIVKAYEEQQKATAEVFDQTPRIERKTKRRSSWVLWGVLIGVCLIFSAGYFVLSTLAPEQRYERETTVADADATSPPVGEAAQPETTGGDTIITTDQGVEHVDEPGESAQEPGIEMEDPEEQEEEPETFDEMQVMGPPAPPVSEPDLVQVGRASEGEPGSQPVGLRLTADAVDDTWMRVLADGVVVYEGILRVQSSAAWEADSLFELKIGKAVGVRLFLNGRSLGVLGSSEQVVSELILNANGIVRKRVR